MTLVADAPGALALDLKIEQSLMDIWDRATPEAQQRAWDAGIIAQKRALALAKAAGLDQADTDLVFLAAGRTARREVLEKLEEEGMF